jgi:23S rRNA maturation mini-RNase III
MLVTYIENYNKKVLMELISTSSETSSKEDIEASVNKHILHKLCKREGQTTMDNPRIKITNTETEHIKRKRNQTIHKTPRNLNISSKPYRENPDRHIGNI